MDTIKTIINTLNYKYELIKDAIHTGNFDKVLHEIKIHIIDNKNIYIILTFLVVLYTLYEQDYTINAQHLKISYKSKNLTQLGGETKESFTNTSPKPAEKASNTSPKPAEKINNTTLKKSVNGIGKDINNNSVPNTTSSRGQMTQLAQGASGLCDGEGTIAKMCRGGKDGVTNYFKFFGYLILAGLAVLSPFVIYIVLVYMMLKIMFTGLKNI